MVTRNPSTNSDTTSRTVKSGNKGVEDTAQDLANAASKQAASYAQEAKESVAAFAEDKKSKVAQEGEGVASALRNAANEMRSGSPQERTLGQIADGIADMSESIRDKDLGQIVGDLNSLARRNPTVFLGGAALLGFAAIRFAKASKDTTGSPYGSRSQSPHQTATSSTDTSFGTTPLNNGDRT